MKQETICPECGGDGVVQSAPAGHVYSDDLAEYVPCGTCFERDRQRALGRDLNVSLEVLKCKHCPVLAVSINGIRFGHKCAGQWSTIQKITWNTSAVMSAISHPNDLAEENSKAARQIDLLVEALKITSESLSAAHDELDSMNTNVDWEGQSEIDPILSSISGALQNPTVVRALGVIKDAL